MSVVGPRPITSAEAERYGPFFQDYLSVRPGITGLWQISGRSALSYEQRVLLDVQYVREQSFFLNLKIIWRTVPAVLFARGSW
jgi:exopolysaccharide production protein ExoY